MGTRTKTIGVLGGMGVRAIWAFCQALTNNINFVHEREHPRVIIDCNTQIPSRTRCYLYGEESPVPAMVKSIGGLVKMGADIVAVPCNQAHYWKNKVYYPEWVDMPSVVLEDAQRRGFLHPVIVGGQVTIDNRLYGLVCEHYNDPNIYKLIAHTKVVGGGFVDDWMPGLLKKGDGVIIACTELRVSAKWEYLVIDSLQVYAREIARLTYD